MKKWILAILALSCCLAAAACAGKEDNTSGLAAELAGTDYEYTYDRPFYSTPDDFMTIDGVFDEEEWENCVWMQTTQFDVTYRITTLFTQKGIYVAAYAEDRNIVFNGRNNFINNSSFEIQIVKENAPRYEEGSRWQQHFMNDFMFHADSQTCRSYRERNFNGAVKCVGEPNSGDTTSLSYEMFLGWDQMHYDESELNPETGIPDSVRIWCQYTKPDQNNSADTRYISPFLMDYGIFTSYYEFGPHGIVNRPDNGVVGSAIGGTTCTDRWIMDNSEKGGPLTVDRYQTQHIWFTHDENGEEISRPTSFIAEAQVTADVSAYTSGQATFGIMTIHDMWSMVTYGVNMSNLINGKQVVLQSIEGIDSSYWVGQQSMSKTVNSDYTANTVCLRLVKLEGYYYYFYKNPSDAEYTYIGYEYWYKNSEDVDVGLFTNCPSTITNYSVADYTGREDELESILSETVYFVDTSNVSGGDVNVDQMVVRQGDALTITATPTNGYILNEFTINGEDMFDEFVEAKGSLEYIPEADVVIEVKFVRIPQEYLQTVSYMVTDPAGNFVSNADYTITSENPLLSKTGTTSGRGMIATSMPRACEFTIGGRKYVCDGEYALFLSKDTYLDTSDAFTLTGGEDIEKTLVMRDARWGKDPMVNGKTVSDSYGGLEYDEAADAYYALNTGVREYYSDTVMRGGQYIYTATVKTVPTQAGTINPVVGMVISSGSSDSTLNFKSAWWETNNLCIEINGKEISVSGFAHSLNNNNADSVITITVARANDTLYVYDGTGALVLTLDQHGVHPYGSRTIVNTAGLSYVESQLKVFFGNGKENVCGPLVIDGARARVDFDISATAEGVEEFIYGGAITVGDSLEYESEKELSAYVKGEEVVLWVWSKDASKAIESLLLTYNGGSEVVEGEFDPLTGKTKFVFVHNHGAVTVEMQTEVALNTVTGTLSGGENYASAQICFGGVIAGTYGGLVQSDGSFTFKAPQGALGMAVICQNKLAVYETESTAGLTDIAISLQDNDLLVGQATLNGGTITSKATLDFATYKAFADGGAVNVNSALDSKEFGNPGRREYALLFTNSVTAENFTVTDVASSSISYGKFGIAVTDGTNILAVQLGAGGNTNQLYVSYGTYGEGGRFNLNRAVGEYSGTGITAHSFSSIALKIVKTDTGITVFVGNTQLAAITNTEIGEQFFVAGREYCCALVSTQLAGDVVNDVSFS